MSDPFYSNMPGPYAVQMLNELWNRVTESISTEITQNLTIALGNLSLNAGADKQYALGQIVRITDNNDVSRFMQGTVTAYDVNTGAMTVAVDTTGGSGSGSDWTLALAGSTGPTGYKGWSPQLAVVSDGARRVYQIVGWTDGEGAQPSSGYYLGPLGPTANIGDATDIRGPIGATGNPGPANVLTPGPTETLPAGSNAEVVFSGASPSQTVIFKIPRGDTGAQGPAGEIQSVNAEGLPAGATPTVTNNGTAEQAQLLFGIPKGDKGDQGNQGWSPVYAGVVDGSRIVKQVTDWVGGQGAKPATGSYVGPLGYVATAAEATDFRGAPGEGDLSVSGPVAGDQLALFTDSSGTTVKAGPAVNSLATLGDLSNLQATIAGDYVAISQKGAANGVATLGADQKIPAAQLPAIAITSVFVVNSQAAQLALAAQEGDVAVRTDITTGSANFIHNGGNTGTMSDWTALQEPVSITWSTLSGKPAVIAAGDTQSLALAQLGFAAANNVVLVRGGTGLPGTIGYTANPTANQIAIRSGTGQLKAAAATAPDELVTKAQLDANSGVKTGDVIQTVRAITAPEFLDPNTVVSQSAYPNLFSLVGLRKNLLAGMGTWDASSGNDTAANNVAWFDNDRALAIGNNLAFRTADKGLTWTAAGAHTSTTIRNVTRMGGNAIFIQGNSSSSLRMTIDGGDTFITVTQASIGGSNAASAIPLSNTTALILNSAGSVVKVDWTSGTPVFGSAVATGVGAVSIAANYGPFTKIGDRIFVVGTGLIAVSRDEGATWTAYTFFSGETPYSLESVGNVLLVQTGSGGTVRRNTQFGTGGPTAWPVVLTGGSYGRLMHLGGNTVIYFNYTGSTYYISYDAGATWELFTGWPAGVRAVDTEISPDKSAIIQAGSNVATQRRALSGYSYDPVTQFITPEFAQTPGLNTKIKS